MTESEWALRWAIHARSRVDSLGRVTRSWRTLVAAAALFAAAPAAGQNPPQEPPSGVSSIDQYVEQIPTSRGSRVAGVGSGKGEPLAPEVRRRLREEGGPDAEALEQIATSLAYGAPEQPLRRRATKETPVRPEDDEPTLAGALSAAVSAPGEGGEWRLGVLAGVLFATTGALGVAAYRRRARR
jgi:hypothetical protein